VRHLRRLGLFLCVLASDGKLGIQKASTWSIVADGQDNGIIIAGVLEATTTISAAILSAHARQLEVARSHAPSPVDAVDDEDALVDVILKRA